MNNGPPPRDRRSLQDLAKLASSPSLAPLGRTSTTPPPSPVAVDELDHDSGIVDLKQIAKVDAEGEVRSRSTPLASAPLFDEELTPARPSSPPATSSAKSLDKSRTAGASSAPASAPKLSPASGSGPRLVTVPAESREKKSPIPWLVGGLAAAALLGGAFFFLRGSPSSTTGVAAPLPSSGAPASTAPSAAAVPSAVAAVPVSPAAPAVASSAPAAEADPAAGPVTKGGVAGHALVRRGSAAAKGAAAAPAGGAGGSTVSALSASMAESTSAPATGAPGSLGDAVQHAVGANGAAPPAAEDTPASPHYAAGSVPEKPSQGTITSALSAVLPEARGCLNPDDPISRAHITFASAGSVSAVSVTGHAAGTAAEGCIKSALLKAKLPPFADATYGATVTIRPN